MQYVIVAMICRNLCNLHAMSPHRSVVPERWSIWRCPAASGASNMAADAALMESATPGRAVWRWYDWTTPTVSFGRNEKVQGRFSEASVASAGLSAVRRPTGGRALLHSHEITYSATFCLDGHWSWRDAYEAVNSILHQILESLGLPVVLAGAHAPMAPDGPVCFDQPSEGELVVAGRKLVGSAVWRQGTQYLQHGSILLHDDQARLAQAASVPLPPAPPAASLLELLPSLGREAALDALDKALAPRIGEVFQPSANLLSRIEELEHEYSDPVRIWRR